MVTAAELDVVWRLDKGIKNPMDPHLQRAPNGGFEANLDGDHHDLTESHRTLKESISGSRWI